MFCGKCGKQLPDGAQFCKYCGNQLKAGQAAPAPQPNPAPRQAPAAQAPQAASAQPSGNPAFAQPAAAQRAAGSYPATRQAPAAQAGGVQPPAMQGGLQPAPAAPAKPKRAVTAAGIVACVAGAAQLVCMLLPWVSVPVANSLGQLGSLIGLDTARDYSYSVFNLGEAVRTMDSIAGTSIGSSYTGFMAAWGVALAAIAAGIVATLVAKRAVALIPGAVLGAGVAAVWFATITRANAEIATATSFLGGVTAFVIPPAVWLTALFGAVGLVLAVIDQVKSPKAPR